MTTHVLLGLTKRRAELIGEADALKTRLAQLGTDAMHLEAVIRQFDPGYDLASIKGIRQRGPDAAQRGERSRVLLDVLREAGEPLAAAEVVRRVMALQGQDAGDKRILRTFSKRISLSLSRQERQGVLRSMQGPGRLMVWDIAR